MELSDLIGLPRPEGSIPYADLLRAQGLALALIATVIERQSLAPPGEVARLLGLLATVTSETDPVQGDILALWSAMAAQKEPRPRQ